MTETTITALIATTIGVVCGLLLPHLPPRTPRFKRVEVTMPPGYYWLVGGRFRKPFLARMGLGYERGHPYIWASVPGATRPTDWVASELEAEGTRFWGPVPMPKEVREQDCRNAAVDLNA